VALMRYSKNAACRSARAARYPTTSGQQADCPQYDENLRRLDELLRQLDGIQTPLVMVEIKGIEISETDMQELGFDCRWMSSRGI
jgi:hypothetical protein